MKPSDFQNQFPGNSFFSNNEHETVAQNIIVILARTGDTWREISWKEYVKERVKDGKSEYSFEGKLFDKVVDYCISEDGVRSFSPFWRNI